MITFTKEQLIASAHARIEFAEMMLSGELEPLKERTWSIELELARIALASLEAAPVAFINGAREPVMYGEHIGIPIGTHLYTAPPAPVVPDEDLLHMAASAIEDLLSNKDRSGAGVWADMPAKLRRAAMLQGAEPVTTAYKLPEGWVMVPVEPTAEMQSAAAGVIRFDTTPINKLWTGNAVYRAMIAAAPQQEVNNG